MATKKSAAKAPEQKEISVSLNLNTIKVPIKGIAPLIMSAFDPKTVRQIEESAPGKAKQGKKKVETPEEQYESSIYYFVDGKNIGMPAVAFKAAMVRAAQVVYDMQMVKTRTLFRVIEDGYDAQGHGLVKINGAHRMRQDMVRVGTVNKVAAPRYRAEFPDWSTTLTIQYVDGQLSEEQIVAFVNAAGFTCGVGEWRPEKSNSGSFGLFQVAQN